MKKFFISADIEGCAAVASQHALAPDRFEWNAARRWMTGEVLAVAEAAFEAGYGEVIVADSHHNAHNIDPDALPDNVRLVRSWPRPLLHMEGVDDPAIAACAFIGYHGGAGAQDSLLAHSFHGGAFRAMRINDAPCSEGYLNAALAGAFGKPVILVAGDQHVIEDAKRYAPTEAGVTTKHSIGWRSQSSLPPRQVQKEIRERARQALKAPLPKPFRIDGPIDLRLEMTTQVAAEVLAYLPEIERLDAFSVRVNLPDIVAATRFVAFAMLYSPTGAVAL